jgi:tetratricopeptide (TPR) repeat protein
VEAQCNLALCYEDGKGVAADAHKAFEWYERAAEAGDAAAQFKLALCYEDGKGIAADARKAFKWYARAAEAGDAAAQCNLAFCYEHGEGVAADARKAVEWYERAAEAGHAKAQYNLALCYELGKGVAADARVARSWLTRASAHTWQSTPDRALECARRHPERVGKLVLTGGFVYEDQLNGFLRWSKLPGVGELLYSLFYNAQLEARYTWSYFDPTRFASVHEFDSLHDFQSNTPGLKAAALAVLRGMDLGGLRPAFSRIQAPTLLVWGREDRVSPPPYGERLATELPHARLVVLERCGHNVMIERAGTYEQLVEEFLSK